MTSYCAAKYHWQENQQAAEQQIHDFNLVKIIFQSNMQ